MAASARRLRSAGPTPCASRPISTFCSTVSQGKSAKDWNTIATSGDGPTTLLPAIVTSPPVAGIRPARMRSSVVFPAAGAAEERDDFVLAQRQADIVENQQILAAPLGIDLAYVVDADQRAVGHGYHRVHSVSPTRA